MPASGYTKTLHEEQEQSGDPFVQVTGAKDTANGDPKGANGMRSPNDSASTEQQLSRLEKQIRDLQEKLEKIYASDLPDTAKESAAKGIYEKLGELMGQKNMLRQTQLAEQKASPRTVPKKD